MKTIKRLENIDQTKTYEENKVNRAVYEAYTTTKKFENDLLDFSEVIWEDDIEEIVRFLKEEEIKEFTISSTFSSLTQRLMSFQKQGFLIKGMIEINAASLDYITGEKVKIPALHLIRG